MRLDHVSYAASHDDLIDVVQRLGGTVGASFSDGGRHPRFGTRNFVLPLAGGTYIEVVAALDHPSTDTRPFGQAVRRRVEQGGGWLGWVVGVDDIAPVEARLQRAAVDGYRHRPDGVELRWKQIGLLALLDDPQLPYFTQWLVDPAEHPSAGARGDRFIARLEIAGEESTVASWLGGLPGNPLGDISVDWVQADEPGLVAVHVQTPDGMVRLD